MIRKIYKLLTLIVYMKTYLLKIQDEKLWSEFINSFPREMDINSAFVELMQERIKEVKKDDKRN